jgi:hypothetical protein
MGVHHGKRCAPRQKYLQGISVRDEEALSSFVLGEQLFSYVVHSYYFKSVCRCSLAFFLRTFLLGGTARSHRCSCRSLAFEKVFLT